MNGEDGLSCPQCAATRDIYRYCMNCGFDYTVPGDQADTAERPAVTIQHVLPPPATKEQTPVVGGRSAPVILGIIVAALFILVLIGAAVVSLIRADDEQPAAGSDTSASQGSTEDPATSGGAQPTCWDGAEVASISECSAPTGTEGLAWVFPSFDQQNCDQERSDPAKWTCTVETVSGGQVQIRYREHKGVQRPLTAYTAKYGPKNQTTVLSARDDVERYVWRSPSASNSGVWSLSSMYAEHPWSVTIRGKTSDDVEAAYNEDVEFRSPRRLSGSPG